MNKTLTALMAAALFAGFAVPAQATREHVHRYYTADYEVGAACPVRNEPTVVYGLPGIPRVPQFYPIVAARPVHTAVAVFAH